MHKKSCLAIGEFARLTGIRKENLRFYDRIGLLSPEFRAENNYRYYTRRQLNTAYLISALRDLGVGLDEIKRYAGQRTPQKMLALFAEQEKRIKAELDRLYSMREIIKIYGSMAKQAVEYDEMIYLQECACEPIFAIPEHKNSLSEDDEIVLAYEDAAAHGISSGSPMGAVLYRPDCAELDRLKVRSSYFKTKRKHNGFKPAGKYAIAYGRCVLGGPDEVCRKLMEFICEQGLSMVGDIYEEYPLNELSVDNEESYCVCLAVRVQ